MQVFIQRFVLTLMAWTLTTSAGVSQQAVPEFRYVVTRDTDFHGSDLEALFDTDLQSCVRTCSAQAKCIAFTYNARSNACFPKQDVREQSAYQGAFSAVKVATDPVVLQRAVENLSVLGFLREGDLERASDQVRKLGVAHPAGGFDVDDVLEKARVRRTAGYVAEAIGWTAMAVSLSDRSDLWAEYARLLLTSKSDNSKVRKERQNQAISASLNAFLRADSPAGKASALGVLATALEQVGRGRDMIDTLRLAQSLQSRQEAEMRLEKAISKYGFRVTSSSVESDSVAPRICAEFSERLARAGIDYEPFVRLPEAGLVVQAEGSQLCIDGLVHGNRYNLTIRQGLPAASGEALQKDVELTHYVRDRSQKVRFPGRSYVLPKTADAAIPVETVNLDHVDLQLRRVSDRNLLRAVQDGYFGRPLSQWQDETFSKEIAEDIWTGTADVSNTLNKDMKTRLPLGAIIADQPTGIYTLTARVPGADPYDEPGATQWFVLSDLGISTMSGTDGLHVMVRQLSDASPKQGVNVTLVSQANAELANSTTDGNGYARFDPGLMRGTAGASPALVIAQIGEEDIGFLSLKDPAFDLSDRGVEGRGPAEPVDVFLTTDRGAYRAGETIHLTALSRDASARAIDGLPLMAVLRRPDGVVYQQQVSSGGVAGGHIYSFPVGSIAPRGTWKLEIRSDAKSPVLATQTVLIEDFLPERIDFDLALPQDAIRLDDVPILQVDARYLFGAVGADLAIEGQVTLKPSTVLKAWTGYRFGRHDAQVEAASNYFGGERTDGNGQASIPLELPEIESSAQPLELTAIVRLADGSARPVERRLQVPVQPDTPVIGIRPEFDESVGEGSEAAFQVIGLAADLSSMRMPVRWTLNRVETRFQWYQLYGNWNWEPTTRRTRIATGEIVLDGPVRISEPVEWGQYELVVERLDGEYTASSMDFYAGWYAPADASATPDRLEMSLDKESYKAGDIARLRIVAPGPGTVLVSVMSNRLIERKSLSITGGATEIPVDVTEDWGTGAYVSATLIRPMDTSKGQNPARSIGLAHASVLPVGKLLNVEIDVPEIAEPRNSQRVRVTVAGAKKGEDVWLTLSAVDLGILNLTGFQSPDPANYYFGQRRLGMELRDVYGRLIDGLNGGLGVVRSGGDNNAGMRRESPPPTQELMARFSGPVQFNPDGEAFVDIDLPAFNGTVRLMAVAWSNSAVGQAETDMVVRDPVVVTASLPNFLAPGDSSRVRLEITHADGPAGEMSVAMSAHDAALTLGEGPGSFVLTRNGKAVFEVPVSANVTGNSGIEIALTTPEGKVLHQSLTLPVLSNDPIIAQTRRFTLGSGNRFDLTEDVFAGFRKGTGSAILSAGPLAKFNAPGLLAMLDRYPYGCTEQVTSQALPLLYLSSVAEATGLGNGPVVQARLDRSIARVLTRQAPNGGFGLWRAESGDFWLDAYVTDFLSRARAEGFNVPDLAFRQALDNLRNRVNYAPDFDEGGEDVAYALMVLAREGAAAIGDLRYYADVKAEALTTPLAAAQLAAALAYYGDQTRADALFALAARRLAGKPAAKNLWRSDYGTQLRDAAGLLTLASEAGSEVVSFPELARQITRGTEPLSTQEAAWSLLAAHALVKSPGQSGLMVNGQSHSGPFVELMDDSDSRDPVVIESSGSHDTSISLTITGVPEIPPEAGGTGYAVTRSYYTTEGAPIDRMTLTTGERVVTVLRIKPFETTGARLMVDDPLPAGLEIDNPSLLRAGDVRALGWLKLSEAEHTEFRSDRFLAAINIRSAEAVTLAYIARAVSPGNFHHPAASVEDMYRPVKRARTATGRLIVNE